MQFATAVLKLTKAALTAKLSMSLDGIVIGMPPENPTDRANHCRIGDTCIWRKDGERANPKLAGYDKYGQLVPALEYFVGGSAFKINALRPERFCFPKHSPFPPAYIPPQYFV